jgi:peptidoglycan/LPS O-acetylase OafA/YrhL
MYHAGFSCSGGYVGVDIFFVISGFLITSLIWKDLESGLFTFAHFWERRARRIVPAMIVVTFMTLAAGWFLLLPPDFKSLGRAAASQAVFAANIHYWQDSGYFAEAADEKPLLHTWSLAVEEQFYLLVPFLLWWMFRNPAMRRRPVVISVLGMGFALSLSLSIFGVNHYPGATFYILPTRAWELLTGALIAFLPPASLMLSYRGLRELFALTGAAFILIPICFYTPETRFPGLAALPPCLGAALLIWANGHAPTAIGKALSMKPVVFIGLISYSLYLWHWPFLAYSKYIALTPLSLSTRSLLVGLGFLFAGLSWKYVETPFRRLKVAASRKSVFAHAAAGLAIVFCCGSICLAMQGFPGRYPAEAQGFANAVFDRAFINDLTVADGVNGNFVQIGVTNPALSPTVLVWGDSHAMAAMPAIDAFLKERGLAGRAATHSSTAPVVDWYNVATHSLNEDSIPFSNSVIAYVRSQQIPIVILSASWWGYAYKDQEEKKAFHASIVKTVRQLAAAGAQPWLLLDVPHHSFNIPRALSRSVVTHTDIKSLCAKPTEISEFDNLDARIISEIEAAGGQVINPKPRFLDPSGQYYIIEEQGIALYRDGHHLTATGAKLMLLPLFRGFLAIGNTP